MKSLLKIILLLFFASSLHSCQDDDSDLVVPQLTCNNTTSTFSTMYNNILINENLISYDHVDSKLHGYVFKVSNTRQICSIGYQSYHEDATVPFDIKIREKNTGIIIYSESHLFTQNNLSYINLDQNIILQPDTEYVLTRIQNNYNNRINNVIGNVIDGTFGNGDTIFLPYTVNEFTILSSRFYNFNDEEVDVFNFLPQIDIVFAE
jgi:hypothetical protein